MGFSSRRCPKCGGMLGLGSYLGEWYEDCVQCGYLGFLKGDPRLFGVNSIQSALNCGCDTP